MTSINGETGKNGFKLRLDYEVTKQSTADNKSTVHMVLYLYANTTGSYNQDGDAYWSINGKKTYYTFSYTSPAWYVLGERTEEISHNNDGTKTVTLSGVWCSTISGGWAPYSLSVSGEVTLPTIPRSTTPGIGGVTMGETAHISLPRASSGFTHTLRYVFGGAAETIASGVTTGYDWLVPESLAAQIPDAASGKGTLTCETYSGSTLIGTKSVTFTASVPGSMKPAVLSGWAAVTYDNSGTAAENMAAWVQGYSKAKAAFDASKVTCRQGAGVSKFSITYLGKTTEGNPCRTETISTTGATVRCTVTDSRGLTAWEDFNIALLEYAPPALVGADLFRSDGEGTAADGGAHIAGVARVRYSELGGLNSVTLKGYWKGVGGSYGAGETLTVGTVGLVTGNVEISPDRSYVALLVLTDSLGNTARYEENIPTEKVAFHLKEGGKGAAFGKAAETEGVLELAEDWHLKLTGAMDLNAAAEKIAVLDPGGVVRYRTKAELQGDLAADYIVSQGTSGIWTYRKWASGVAECWLESELTLTGSTPVANMNDSAYLSYVDVDLPFTFKTQPRAVANGVLGTGTGFVNVWCRNGYNEITVYVTGNQNNAAITIRSMIVTGRWK
ncbi:MAG: hypothetical protein EGQ48_02995 [Clostridiales bacterium]|nr:hypothetical protein [Clostridiales bacterium]